jgi:hypothetical protein
MRVLFVGCTQPVEHSLSTTITEACYNMENTQRLRIHFVRIGIHRSESVFRLKTASCSFANWLKQHIRKPQTNNKACALVCVDAKSDALAFCAIRTKPADQMR